MKKGSTNSNLIKRLATGVAVLALTAGSTVAIAGVASAGQCSSKTGGSSNSVMFTGSGFTCAYQAESGEKKIGSWNTQSWTSSTAKGYSKRTDTVHQTGSVTITYIYTNSAGTGLGSSITYTAFNGATSSRHWGAGVIWNTSSAGSVDSSQYASTGYDFNINKFTVGSIPGVGGPNVIQAGSAASYTVYVQDPDGGTVPTGAVQIYRQVGSQRSTPGKTCSGSTIAGSDVPVTGVGMLYNGAALVTTSALPAGSYNLYAVYSGTLNSQNKGLYCSAPPNSGVTAANSVNFPLTVQASNMAAGSVGGQASESLNLLPTSDGAASDEPAGDESVVSSRGEVGTAKPSLKVINRTFNVGRNGGAKSVTVKCGSGWVPMQTNASSSTRVLPENLFSVAGSRVGIRSGKLPAGTKVNFQTVCRPANAKVAKSKGSFYGSRWADRLSTQRVGTTIFGGLGNDVITVRHSKSGAWGGAGSDRIIVTSKKGFANGGVGNDYLEAKRSGKVLLVGGLGRDTLVGAKGKTLINARDGQGGDRIICNSKKNRVAYDKGDKLIGPCSKYRLS